MSIYGFYSTNLVLQRPETSATVDYKNYRFTIFFALPSE